MSLFSKRHYRFIARAIDESRNPIADLTDFHTAQVRHLISILSFAFKHDNPRFDAETFRVACGEKPEHSD